MSRGRSPRDVVDALFRGGRITQDDRDILNRAFDRLDVLSDLLAQVRDAPAALAELRALRAELAVFPGLQALRDEIAALRLDGGLGPRGQTAGEGASACACGGAAAEGPGPVSGHARKLEAAESTGDCNREGAVR